MSPETVQTSWAVVHPKPEGDDVTSYVVIDCPPVFTGALHEIVADVSDTTTPVSVGASGIPKGTTCELLDTAPNV